MKQLATSQVRENVPPGFFIFFLKGPDLLQPIGVSAEFNENARMEAQHFVCHLFGNGNSASVNGVRLKMFMKEKSSIEALVPTEAALFL